MDIDKPKDKRQAFESLTNRTLARMEYIIDSKKDENLHFFSRKSNISSNKHPSSINNNLNSNKLNTS